MADKKISELPTKIGLSNDDLLLLIDSPSDSPTNKNITVENFFKNVPVVGDFPQGIETTSIKSDELHLEKADTPVSSSDTDSFEGTLAFDDNYLYIKISPSVIKRVKLENF